jgi:hypothetical protein
MCRLYRDRASSHCHPFCVAKVEIHPVLSVHMVIQLLLSSCYALGLAECGIKC